MGTRLRRLSGAAAVLFLGAVLLIGHPAGESFVDRGRDIARFTAASHRGIAALGVVDAAAPAAAAVLLVSVLVAGALGSALLAGPRRAEGLRKGGAAPGAALLGHGGGIIAVMLGGGGPAFYATAGILSAAVLLRPHAVHGPRPRAWRTGALLLLGALLFLAAGGADGILQAAAGSRPFPEAWFVLAAESGGGWFRLSALGTFAAIAAAAAGMECAAERDGEGDAADLLFTAAAWALLLGPSNPCRALALAWSLRCLARAGLPPLYRAAFAAALVGGMAALVFA